MLPTLATIWVVFLLAAAIYVRHARHPRQKPLAAYLIFVLVFSATAFFMFGVLTYLAGAMGWLAVLDRPTGATLFLILVFAPALVLARWQISRPPRQAPPPD